MNTLHQDNQIILDCLNAAAKGPFFPEWEFSSLMGMDKAAFTEIATQWPNVDMDAEIVRTAVSNALLNLSGYPIDAEEEWPNYISVPRQELEEVRARFDNTATTQQ